MRRLGKVQGCNDDRGYGFIVPLDVHSRGGHGRAFLHIRDHQQEGRRPESGELVDYLARTTDDGRQRR